jgi:hypothetical protein
MGRKGKTIVGYNKLKISATTHQSQTITSVLERYIPVDEFEFFDQCNPTNIDDDMTMLVGAIATHFEA